VELDAIRSLLAAGVIVIGVGGGGIPVVADADGDLQGVEAVIDKDLGCSLLARNLGAELFLISTSVEKVALNFGTPAQRWVDHLSLAEARRYLAEGVHFAAGSMAPKIEAVIEYLENGGRHAIVTDTPNLARAVAGRTGTHFTVD
jgi:carbamate kinase